MMSVIWLPVPQSRQGLWELLLEMQESTVPFKNHSQMADFMEMTTLHSCFNRKTLPTIFEKDVTIFVTKTLRKHVNFR